MATDLYWVEGPWPGKVAVAARPRGGDWLEEDVRRWRANDFDTVLSLLTSPEEMALDLRRESDVVKASGMNFLSLPIPDREVPVSETEVSAVLENLNRKLASGKNVLIHCRQGIGRSGLIAACLLVSQGLKPQKAISQVEIARGIPIPETIAQKQWIDHYADVLAEPNLLLGAHNRAPHTHP